MMRWYRPEFQNVVRDLSRDMLGAALAHVKSMHHTMKYYVGMPEHGLVLKQMSEWDGNPSGRLDSDYAKDTDTGRSMISNPHVQQHAEERDVAGDGRGISSCNTMQARHTVLRACH
jgi:hypothetical protein